MEKRLYPRVPDRFPIQYKTIQGWISLGKIFNLSQSGMGIHLLTFLTKEDSIHWRFPDKEIEAKGKVVWTDPFTNRCGIQIFNIDSTSQIQLAKCICENPNYQQAIQDFNSESI